MKLIIYYNLKQHFGMGVSFNALAAVKLEVVVVE
jgi:hypothetical protein